MRNGIITIMKKELARFFGDRRMVVSILMPGVLLYKISLPDKRRERFVISNFTAIPPFSGTG